jgi:hypothetical protein
MRRRTKALCAAGLISGGILCGRVARADKPASATELKPSLRIPVAPLGYLPPGAFYSTYRLSSAAMGFFDDDRLLFTFQVSGLMKRLPGDQGEDQQIRAVVLNAHTGRMLKQTQWRLRDRDPYLWPFVKGQFLLRIENTLYLLGPSLELQPYLRTPETLRLVEISPQRRWMVVEYDSPSKAHRGPSLESGSGTTMPVKVAFLRVGFKKPLAQSEMNQPGGLPLMGDGLMDVAEGKGLTSWVIREMPFAAAPQLVGSVHSFCRPEVQPLSETVALVTWCSQANNDRPVFAVNLAGKELWQDTWQQKYVWPYFDFAENGSRFAYESVEINVPMSIVTSTLDQDEIVGQMVGVYDTESGKPVLVRDVSPVLTAGQNVALSPDGRRFAVLRHGAIEIYDLPPLPTAKPALGRVPEEKQSK